MPKIIRREVRPPHARNSEAWDKLRAKLRSEQCNRYGIKAGQWCTGCTMCQRNKLGLLKPLPPMPPPFRDVMARAA